MQIETYTHIYHSAYACIMLLIYIFIYSGQLTFTVSKIIQPQSYNINIYVFFVTKHILSTIR